MSSAGALPHVPATKAGFLLGDVRVEPDSGLISGAGGTEQLDPRVMDVLQMLAEHAGELVSRAQLLEALWPGLEVYEDALTQCVYQLRRQLAEAGGHARYRNFIVTLPKRGYRLDCDVVPLAADTFPAAQTRRPFAAVATSLLVLILIAVLIFQQYEPKLRDPTGTETSFAHSGGATETLAVLPFLNTRGDSSEDYLSNGVSDGLRDRLANEPGLRVVARRSSSQFRDFEGNEAEIGRLLGVGRIIEGRLTRDQGRVLVSVELVDATSGFLLWSQTYEQADRNLLLAERALADDLVGQLLSGRQRAPRSPPSKTQLASHELMLLARQYEQQVTDEQRVDETSLRRAIELYQQVLNTDPESAEGHARLARMLLYAGDVVGAEPHALYALELDPERADSFTTLGLYYWAVREENIGDAYRRAIALNPNDPDALSFLASWAWMQGDTASAVEYYEMALQLDPLSLVRYADLGYKLAFAGDAPAAKPVMERMLELFPTAPGYLVAVRMSEALGQVDEAIAWALKARRLRLDDAEVNGQLAELLARIGDFETAGLFEPEPGMAQLYYQRRYVELVALGEELYIDHPGDLDVAFTLAFAHAALGQYEAAIRIYEAAGLPDTALAESRRANEIHALQPYACTLWVAGRENEAREIILRAQAWSEPLNRSEGVFSWVARVARASGMIILGERERALQLVASLGGLPTLPRPSWYLDDPCFRGFREEPEFLAMAQTIEQRMAEQRARLPQTLARHGVALLHPGPP